MQVAEKYFKMFGILIHEVNANENYFQISSYLNQNGQDRRNK